MKERFRRFVPPAEDLRGHRLLRWMGPALQQPRLWRVSRRTLALGVALGIFFGLLIPVAQIPVSATAAVLLRANLPAAVASTLVTNPVTFGPIYYGAWRLGSAVTGEQGPPAAASPQVTVTPAVVAEPASWLASAWTKLTEVGKPLLLGLLILAVGAGGMAYVLSSLAWTLYIRWKRKRRRHGGLVLSESIDG